MNNCPECKTMLEPWEVACHSCGLEILSDPPLRVADVAPAKPELEEAYASWLKQGKEALAKGDFEEACNCLREAIKRSRPLDDAQKKETEARKCLGEALEKLSKLQEAADQYRIIAQESTSEELRESWLKRSQDLVAASSTLPYELLFQKEEFRTLRDEEIKVVPLYCLGCKRLLAEAEVYGFRRAMTGSVRCWCGVDGRPLAKQDAKHSRALKQAQSNTSSQRARAIEVASQKLPEGKRKFTAAVLALTLGWIGVHKFYLGETTAGMIYALWCWTGIPLLISIYEAIVLFEMSTINFNMTYNIELVLAQTEPQEESRLAKMDVFSMESEPEPEESTSTAETK
jgi:TM2 domain-containing membrane protein YozV